MKADTKTIQSTLEKAQKQVTELVDEGGIKEVVADKGYHSGDILRQLDEQQIRSYIPETRPGKAALAGRSTCRRTINSSAEATRKLARAVRFRCY